MGFPVDHGDRDGLVHLVAHHDAGAHLAPVVPFHSRFRHNLPRPPLCGKASLLGQYGSRPREIAPEMPQTGGVFQLAHAGLQPVVEKDVKAYLIFDAIAKEENMTVAEGENLPNKVMAFLMKEAKWEEAE